MIKPGLVKSSIRTARMSGPNGHASGKSWDVIRQMAISPYHDNCVSRNHPSASIVLPLLCKKTQLIVGALPLYMGVTEETKAASGVKTGIPQYGFHIKPGRAPMIPLVPQKEEKNSTHNVSQSMEVAGQKMNQELTLARYNGARILKQLAEEKPHLATSMVTVEWMLEKETSVRNDLQQKGKLNGPYFTDNLGKSDCTVSFAPAYAHRDKYPKIILDASRMQGKVTMPMGVRQSNQKLANYGTIMDTNERNKAMRTVGYQTLNGKLPPGTLFYIRYNMASMCKAMSDVELHCLHNEAHCSAASDSSTNTMAHRGVWILDDNGTWCFYPGGYTITAY
jgi:hypothetical protein